jgi:hydrogenase-4 component F
MVLHAYIAVVLALLVATQLLRSLKTMNLIALGHSLGVVAMTAYILFNVGLPAYYFDRNLYVDHLALYQAMIAGAIFALAAVYARGHAEALISLGVLERNNMKKYYLCFNALLTCTVLAFFSNNLALFWIFVEITTFFCAFLIAILNTKKNVDASLKYVFVTSTAMLFSFIGIIILFALTEKALGPGHGTLDWDELMKNAQALPARPLLASFAFMFVGFAAKSGIAPFHTSLPHAYSKAPSAVSIILSAAMLNTGIYGIMRTLAIVRQTDAAAPAANLLIAFGVLSLFVAAFSMLKQSNLKKLIAFSSTEHAGLMLIGLGVGTPLAIFWVLYHMLAHSLTKALLFLSAGILHRQYLSNKSENIKDPLRLQPYASAGLILGAVSITGMPPSMIFISKLSMLLQIAEASLLLLFPILLLLLVAASAFAMYLARIFSQAGEVDENAYERFNAPASMKIPIAVLMILIFILGLCVPEALERTLSSAVTALGF